MKKTVLILAVAAASISCTMGPKVMFTDDKALGDLTVPVEYAGGLPSVEASTAGVLRINASTTRFVSERGTTHLNLPTSSIRDVAVRTEAELKVGRALYRLFFMSFFAFFVKDKTEFLSLEISEPGMPSPTLAEFKIKVGSGQALKGAIIEKRDMAVAALTPGEKPAAAKPEYERAFDRAMAIDTIPAWEEYIRTQTNPEFRDKARLRLKVLLEESDWKATRAADTVAKYEEFLGRNPNSKHAEEARVNINRIKEGQTRPGAAGLATGLAKPAEKEERPAAQAPASQKDSATVDQKLRGAILLGKADEVSTLIKAGADANLEFNLGATGNIPPMFLACTISTEDPVAAAEIVRALIRAGADVQYKYNSSANLLFMGVQYGGNPAIIEPLVKNGLDINGGNHLGQTPLHCAAFHGKAEWIEPLIRSGAVLNPKDQDGQTPLHIGAKEKKKNAVERLIIGGADVNAKTNFGATPLDFAESDPELAALIRKHGGVSGKK